MKALRSVLVLFLPLSPCLLAQTAPAPTPFPPVRSQVIVGTQQRRIGESYQKTMEIGPKVIVEGSARLTPIPEAEATMMIVTMDTRAKYTQKVEVYHVLSRETLPVPAANNGDRRTLTFTPSSVTFDSYRDSTNIGGAVYKYYVYALRDSATKNIVDFQTNYTQLAAAVKTDPSLREEILKLNKGANFPTTFKK